jgi:Zn-dependent peptidase ImmA (M78 family)
MGREHLARAAVTAALRLRSDLAIPIAAPVCPFDIAEALKITVHFQAIPSLEGIYTPDGPRIVIGSLRPAGRRAFTCGHELGHHTLGHGLSVDELVDDEDAKPKADNEYAADRFASALLMPKLAVTNAFSSRGWSITSCTAEQAYVIAGAFGVGYTTLVGYMAHTLRVITTGTRDGLTRIRPNSIRKQILGFDPPHGLIVIDAGWGERPIDLQVGDMALLPKGTRIEGGPLDVKGATARGVLAHAIVPGTAVVTLDARTITARVARPAFEGLAIYRHLEDADDD